MYREKRKGVSRLTGGALAAYPIGAVYISFVNTDPATIFGGTWVSIGSGRMLIGVDPGDATMDAPGDIGGNKTMSAADMPQHLHGPGTLAASSNGSHEHNVNRRASAGAGGGTAFGGGALAADMTTGPGGAHSHDVTGNTSNAGGGTAGNNLPPYYAVYMWRRSA